jgi:hypothetical protein
MARNQTSLSAAYEKVGMRTAPTFNLQGVKKITKDSFRIIVSAAIVKDYNEQSIVEGVNTLVAPAFQIIANSINPVPYKGQKVFSMVVAANREVKDYADAEKESMKLITANVFQDSSESIWNVVGEGDARQLVQVSNEDYESILKSRLSRRVVLSSVDATVDFALGDYALCYNPLTASIDDGYLVKIDDKVHQFARNTETLRVISPEQIVDAFEVPEEAYVLSSVAYTAADASKYLDYMKKLYQGTAFYTRMVSIVNQKRALDAVNRHSTTAEKGAH